MGPITLPCGTPLVTGRGEDVAPPKRTCWVLSVKKSEIQDRVGLAKIILSEPTVGYFVKCLPEIHNNLSVCSLLSNGFAKSVVRYTLI